MKTPKFLSLTDIFELPPRSPLWAINNSPNSDVARVGSLIIPISKPNGTGFNHLNVPVTWLPVDLTMEIPREHILDSAEFRQALGKGLLGIISDADAKRLLSDPDAKEEQRRLRDAKRQSQLAVSKSLTDSTNTATTVEEAKRAGADFVHSGKLAAAGVKDFAPGITMNFKMMVDRWAGLPDAKILSELRIQRSFKISQIKFMIENLGEKPDTIAQLTKILTRKRLAKAKKRAAA